MSIITLDFETFFSDDFTLSKMTTEEYVRDRRFEVHGAAIRLNDKATEWYDHAELVKVLPYLVNDPSTDGVLCHHAHFDGLILCHVYGLHPKMWYDTLSMGRLLLGNHLSKSLDSLSKHFNLQTKDVPYHLFKGKHWGEISPGDKEQIGRGACHDVQITWDLFCLLARSFPAEEYALVDATVRMFTNPRLVGNIALLGEIWAEEQKARSDLLAELGVTAKDLGSNEKFAALLRAEGVEPETKPGKNSDNYAFAKTDDFMRDLLDDEDERVAMLAEARLQAKSTLTQTRSERLGWMATRGPLPVYLNYCGAHTTRWSGGDKVNWQNRKRGGKMERAIEAPAGHAIVVTDASQIECRILNMVAGQWDVIERFRNHEDPYTGIASKFYGFEVTKAHEKERGTGKQLELSCGYGAGGPTIQATAKKGTYGPPVYLSAEQAMQARDLYRETHPAVTDLWAKAKDVLTNIASNQSFDWGPATVQDKRIWLPNGAPLIYETLEWFEAEDGDRFWRIKTRRGHAKLYGAKLVENFIQALARVHTSQAWSRCIKVGIPMVSMEHDKLLACVSENQAEDAYQFMRQEMARAPVWLPGIPLDSEGFISSTFAKPEK